MADLDVKAMDWARREADRLVFATNTIREMRDAIKDALLSAHEAGRAAGAEQMREAAAHLTKSAATCLSCGVLFDENKPHTDEDCGRHYASWSGASRDDIAEAIRALPLPAPPKETGE